MTDISLDTTMPSTVVLTARQEKELKNLEQRYQKTLNASIYNLVPLSAYSLMEERDIKHTTNVGLHWFCIKNDLSLRDLSANTNISIELAYLILENANSKGETITANSIRRGLLFNHGIYEDLTLFKLVLDSCVESGKNSALRKLAETNLIDAPIDIFMFLISTNKITTPYTIEAYLELSKKRSKDIQDWATKNNPELAGVPASWVLRAYGFSEFVE